MPQQFFLIGGEEQIRMYKASGEKLCDMNSVLQHGEFEQQIKAPILIGKYRKWTK